MGSYWDASGKVVDGRYESIIKSSGGVEPDILSAAGDSYFSATVKSITTLNVGYSFNGIDGWDRNRNNTQGTLLASAARTATTNSPNQTNYNARGILFTLNVTAASGTGGLQIQLAGIDPVSGLGYFLTAAPTAVLAVGTYAYEMYPGDSAASASVSQKTAGVLPRSWFLRAVHVDATSYTYSVGYSLIL